jgi:hypothetical protein
MGKKTLITGHRAHQTNCLVENEMTPEELHNRIKQLIAEDGDHCMSCGKEFPHGSVTCFCETDGDVAIVGECCVGKFKTAIRAGPGILHRTISGVSG